MLPVPTSQGLSIIIKSLLSQENFINIFKIKVCKEIGICNFLFSSFLLRAIIDGFPKGVMAIMAIPPYTDAIVVTCVLISFFKNATPFVFVGYTPFIPFLIYNIFYNYFFLKKLLSSPHSLVKLNCIVFLLSKTN